MDLVLLFFAGIFSISTLIIFIMLIKQTFRDNRDNNFTEPITVESLPMYTPKYELTEIILI